jgi:hypothetical protein
MIMKRSKLQYIVPQVEEVAFAAESFTLASSLEDYQDNPIFAPEPFGNGNVL